jgi:magnesium chelatase subunit D
VSGDPFGALGLPVAPDLTDDDVRAAWRRVAAASHPDREDGGDPARFALAAAAYTELRTRYGRGEAYADLVAGQRRPPAAARPVPGPDGPDGSDGPDGPDGPAPGRAGMGLADPASGRAGMGLADPASGRAGTGVADPASGRAGTGVARRRYGAVASLAFRVAGGRPGVLALRLAIAAAVSAAGFAVTGAQPAAFGLATGAVTWFLLTVRHDLAR